MQKTRTFLIISIRVLTKIQSFAKKANENDKNVTNRLSKLTFEWITISYLKYLSAKFEQI